MICLVLFVQYSREEQLSDEAWWILDWSHGGRSLDCKGFLSKSKVEALSLNEKLQQPRNTIIQCHHCVCDATKSLMDLCPS